MPVIATGVGIANEIIIDGETGYVVPGDPKAICERLGQMADASAREEMGRNIRKRVRENFAWDKVMDRYLALYRSFYHRLRFRGRSFVATPLIFQEYFLSRFQTFRAVIQ